ncbi:50S ribosomal protein L17 [Pseudarthrobacter sulfonivorans]|uniref:50S ribosomal protein L17 n=1 Tax=Pseudarthrobacter sulfonivorans TaxID=121292 RepID=UPI002789F289|nr:50S ribosomal protein L17 [Pseudarthrobacter sulfonivorans]MDP9997782.1 large subunit ribosomal protein L17 [Pseudarthrobacter sulfonivorans]
MPTPAKGPRLGGGAAHERLMLANLSAALFEHKRITTTVTKAKRLKPYAERLVTFAKRGDLASRRRVLGLISNKGIVHELFTDIAQAVENREGGYTRITKIGNRKGDNAPMAVIELVLEPVSAKQAVVAEATSAAKRDADKKEAAAAPVAEEAAEAPEAEVVETEAAAAPEAEAEAATEEAPAAEEAATEEAPAAKKAAKAPAAKKKDEDEAK